MPDLVKLPPKERAKRYRELAADALREATRATSDESTVRESYLTIAEQYQRLALDAEAEISES